MSQVCGRTQCRSSEIIGEGQQVFVLFLFLQREIYLTGGKVWTGECHPKIERQLIKLNGSEENKESIVIKAKHGYLIPKCNYIIRGI